VEVAGLARVVGVGLYGEREEFGGEGEFISSSPCVLGKSTNFHEISSLYCLSRLRPSCRGRRRLCGLWSAGLRGMTLFVGGCARTVDAT
jgi:hypothetical protein